MDILTSTERVGRTPPFWIPLMLFFAVSVVVHLLDLDRVAAREFWSSEDGWRFKHSSVVNFLYDYGPIPAIALSILALAAWILSFVTTRFLPTRTLALFLVLAFLIGPGLLVNSVLKQHYGRPRPREVIEFGGESPFRTVGESPFTGSGRSFPSGHASTGFFWLAPAVYLWPRSRKLAVVLVGIALVHGTLMSFTRMAMGGHWLSDNLWAAALVYFTAWAIWFILWRIQHPLVMAQWTRSPVARSPDKSATAAKLSV